MFPLNPDFLLLVKFFVVITCVCFWIDLFLGMVRRGRRHHTHSANGGHPAPPSAK